MLKPETTPSEHGEDNRGGGLGLVVLAAIFLTNILYTGTALTQYYAYHFNFSPNLGEAFFDPLALLGRELLLIAVAFGVAVSLSLALFRSTRPYAGLGILAGSLAYIGTYGPFYVPHKGIMWLNAALGDPRFAWMEDHALFVVAGALVLGFACTGPIMALQRSFNSGSHGTATWSNGHDLKEAKEGIILGRKDGDLLRHQIKGHLLTVAATRTGKGIGSVIPNMLDYPGSTLVNDLKGEIYAVTSDYRSKPESEGGLGQKTYALDPFRKVESNPARFNPVDLIQPGEELAGDDANMIANMIVPMGQSSGGNSEHFRGEARQFIAGLILYVAATEPPGAKTRSLPYVRELIMLPKMEDDEREEVSKGFENPNRDHVFDADYFDADYEDGPRGRVHTTAADAGQKESLGMDANGRPMTREALLSDMQKRVDLFSGRIASSANQILQKPGRERGSVVSTAQRATNFIESVAMKRSLCQSDFRFTELMNGETSIYLILDPNRLRNYREWLRMMVSCAVRAVVGTPGKPEHQILFLLDEFANMGKMEPVKEAYSLMAGYGISLWVFVQELPQLKEKYKEGWESFISNADVMQAFGNADPMTKHHISKRAGETTIFVKSEGSSSSSSSTGGSSSSSENYSEKKRRLLTEDEVERELDGKQIIFVRGKPAVKADKIRYYEDDFFKDRAQPNPMYDDVPSSKEPAPGGNAKEESQEENTHTQPTPSPAPSNENEGEAPPSVPQQGGEPSPGEVSQAPSGDGQAPHRENESPPAPEPAPSRYDPGYPVKSMEEAAAKRDSNEGSEEGDGPSGTAAKTSSQAASASPTDSPRPAKSPDSIGPPLKEMARPEADPAPQGAEADAQEESGATPGEEHKETKVSSSAASSRPRAPRPSPPVPLEPNTSDTAGSSEDGDPPSDKKLEGPEESEDDVEGESDEWYEGAEGESASFHHSGEDQTRFRVV